jgi:hypothetical protein
MFGAYFGLSVCFFLTSKKTHGHPDNTSCYSSDLFSFAGTLFLWLLWPSFNAVIAAPGRPRVSLPGHNCWLIMKKKKLNLMLCFCIIAASCCQHFPESLRCYCHYFCSLSIGFRAQVQCHSHSELHTGWRSRDGNCGALATLPCHCSWCGNAVWIHFSFGIPILDSLHEQLLAHSGMH